MSTALFDLNADGEVIPTLDCGHHTDGGDGPEHEELCLGGVCPCCLEPAGGYDVWLHHNPRGYVNVDGVDYCAFQLHMFEARATCVDCGVWLFGSETCPQAGYGMPHPTLRALEARESGGF